MPRLNICNFLVPYTTFLLLLSNVLGLMANSTTSIVFPTTVSVVTLPVDAAAKVPTMPTILGISNAGIDSSNVNRTTSSPQTISTDLSSVGVEGQRNRANVSRASTWLIYKLLSGATFMIKFVNWVSNSNCLDGKLFVYKIYFTIYYALNIEYIEYMNNIIM